MKLSTNIEKGISRYLSEVKAQIGNRPKEEQTELIRALEEHIIESLTRSNAGDPDISDLKSVLAEMDPPESYGTETDSGNDESKFQKLLEMSVGKWALTAFLAAICVFVVFYLIAILASSDSLIRLGTIFGGVLAITAFVLGLFGWKETSGKVATVGSVIIILIALLFIPVRREGQAPEPEQTIGQIEVRTESTTF